MRVTTEEFDTAVKSVEDHFEGGFGNPESVVKGMEYAKPFLSHEGFIARGMRDHATLLVSLLKPEKSASNAAAIFLSWMAIGVAIGRAQVEKEQLTRMTAETK